MKAFNHYGVLGMKWGVRRTPEQLGHNKPKVFHKKYADKYVDNIISTMSSKDKELLAIYDEEYGHKAVATIIKKVGKTPVSFVDIDYEDGFANVSVGTRSGDSYRGKGYVQESVQVAKEWWDNNKYKYGNVKLRWWAREDNPASIKVAEKSGFKYNDKSSKKYKNWRLYEY